MTVEKKEIQQLKNILFTKYRHILNHQDEVSIEDAIEQIVHYYEDAIGCMPGNVYLFDKNLAPITCNKNVLNMLGYQTVAEFKNKTFEQMGKDGNWAKIAEQSFKKDTLEVIETKNPKLNVEEPPIPGADGKMIYFLSSRVPLFNQAGDVSGIVGISIDITEIKKMAISLQNAKEAAEAASVAKTEFIRNMSHDMRTPLTGIIGMAEILNQKPDEAITKEAAQDIHQAGIALLNLLNEIIETAQLESGELKYQKECFALRDTINALASIFRPAVKQKGLSLETYYDDNIPPFLYGQELLLHRIILNLLGNAVKFTYTGSIGLEVSLLQKTTDKVSLQIVVKDTGIGIPADKQEIIFDKFSRLTPSSQNQYKGSGLGLYVVKQFMEKLGGDIQVHSAPDKGAQFICTLQFKLPTPAQLKKYKPGRIQESQYENFESEQVANAVNVGVKVSDAPILLVEDNELVQKVTVFNLKSWGYGNVDVAEDGKGALKKIAHKKYDLIYLDLGLPDMDGRQLAQHIRNHPSLNQNTAIIALTAHADEKIKKECIALGMNQALTKPLLEADVKKFATSIFSHPDERAQEPIVDWVLWRNRCGGHEDLIQQAWDITMRLLIEFKTQSNIAMQTKDYVQLDEVVHKCYGGLKYCGLPKLESVTATLQQKIRNKQYDEIEVLHQQFIEQLDAALALEYNPAASGTTPHL